VNTSGASRPALFSSRSLLRWKSWIGYITRVEARKETNPVPSGIRAIAILFVLCGIYLGVVGLLTFSRPGLVGMSAGAPLLFGLELAGPYMFLLMSALAGSIAFGLMRRINLTRHAAIVVAIAGIAMLVPSVSAAAATIQTGALIRGGAGVIIRVIVAWHLSRPETAEDFSTKQKASS
jgi:hypothetical protein